MDDKDRQDIDAYLEYWSTPPPQRYINYFRGIARVARQYGFEDIARKNEQWAEMEEG